MPLNTAHPFAESSLAAAMTLEIVALARRLDFVVSASDLIEDPQSTSLDGWWKRSALGLRPAGDRD